jgi:hypothetical protein
MIAFPLTVMLAAASYKWLEARFLLMKGGLRGSPWRFLGDDRSAAVHVEEAVVVSRNSY